MPCKGLGCIDRGKSSAADSTLEWVVLSALTRLDSLSSTSQVYRSGPRPG